MERKKQRRDEELLQKIILRVKELRHMHVFYGNCRIQGADPAVQQARLALCIGVKNVIFNVLTMFKINVPEKM